MKIRYLKVLRDLTTDVTKNILLVVAMMIGIFGIGAILGGYGVITREMAANYGGTNPASATIETDSAISPSVAEGVKKITGIKEVERHATVVARMKIDGKWYPLLLFVIDDFDDKQTNKIRNISGEISPADQSMLAERTALTVMHASEGEMITIKTPHGQVRKIKIAGVVHDAGLAPAWQEQTGYGYITLSTLQWLGETQGFDQLRIRVAENQNDIDHITQVAGAAADFLKTKNYHVHGIQIPPPGKHPHQGQMNAVLTIFIIFSFLILILGSILVAASMATLMVKHVRQIGVMKTIGANSIQIGKMYFFMMLLLCIAALIIGIPLSRLAASGLYSQIAILLNLEIVDNTIPLWVLLIQIGSGIFIPMIITAFPVVNGSRISVRQALDSYGVQHISRENPWYMKIFQHSFVNEIFRLSLRNVFRHRSRLAMTLGLLAAGGAMYMTALNVSEAWNKNLTRIYTQRLYDQEVKLNDFINTDSLVIKIKKIKGVKDVEAWSYAPVSFVTDNAYEISRTYPDKGHGSFTMHALPLSSTLLNPQITEGRWLKNDNANEALLNQMARASSKIGDSIALAVDGLVTKWKIVGFTEDVGSPSVAYVSLHDFQKYTHSNGETKMIRIAYNDRSQNFVTMKNKEVEALLEKENISVSSSIPVWLLHNAIAAHMKVLVNSLMAMAILMAIVGTLGLASTISMNVMERTREIGVMRAIGATPEKIKNLIVWEGLTIGAMSIAVALSLAILLSIFMGRFIGNMAFRTPLSLTLSLLALVTWIIIIAVGSWLATRYPARRASKITTREALSYE
jgi:putative ABC transport system permease protein